MRSLLISALAASLVGCTSLVSERNAAQYSKSLTFKVKSKTAKSTALANSRSPPSAHMGKTKRGAKRAKSIIAGKMERSASAHINGPVTQQTDLVTEKAKATIAEMIQNPESAEFSEIRRAKKDLRGESLDTVCGFVKGKSESGEDVREMPFVFIVPDKAYLVDGSNLSAETVYRVLCKGGFQGGQD